MAKPKKPWEATEAVAPVAPATPPEESKPLEGVVVETKAEEVVAQEQVPPEESKPLEGVVVETKAEEPTRPAVEPPAITLVEETPETTPKEAETGADLGENLAPIEGVLLDMVIVVVPKQFTLNLDHSKQVVYKPGTQRMERDHASHWWAVANGVTIFKG